jgi:hypothetical protein
MLTSSWPKTTGPPPPSLAREPDQRGYTRYRRPPETRHGRVYIRPEDRCRVHPSLGMVVIFGSISPSRGCRINSLVPKLTPCLQVLVRTPAAALAPSVSPCFLRGQDIAKELQGLDDGEPHPTSWMSFVPLRQVPGVAIVACRGKHHEFQSADIELHRPSAT